MDPFLKNSIFVRCLSPAMKFSFSLQIFPLLLSPYIRVWVLSLISIFTSLKCNFLWCVAFSFLLKLRWVRATAFSLRNCLLEILDLAGTTCLSLFFSETLMLLEGSPAAVGLYTAQQQRAQSQEWKALWLINTTGGNSLGTLHLPNSGCVQDAWLTPCLSKIYLVINNHSVTDGHWFYIDWWITSSSSC